MKVQFFIEESNKFGSIKEPKSIHSLVGQGFDRPLGYYIDAGLEAAFNDGVESVYLYGPSWELRDQVKEYLRENYSNIIVTGNYGGPVVAWIDCYPKKIGALTFIKKRGRYENKNCSFEVETSESLSFNWWKFSTMRKGKFIFNNFHYSSSTSNHQNNVSAVCDVLGLKSDIRISTWCDLKNLALCAVEIEGNILKLLTEIMKRGTRATSNQERLERVDVLSSQVQGLKRLFNSDEKNHYKAKKVEYKVQLKAAKAKSSKAMLKLQERANRPQAPKAKTVNAPIEPQEFNKPEKAKFIGLKLV